MKFRKCHYAINIIYTSSSKKKKKEKRGLLLYSRCNIMYPSQINLIVMTHALISTIERNFQVNP
jgi:hypothetical protein